MIYHVLYCYVYYVVLSWDLSNTEIVRPSAHGKVLFLYISGTLRVRLNRPGKVLRKLLCGTVKYYVMLLRRIPARYGYLPQEDNRAQR
jgi:hypothetical protein